MSKVMLSVALLLGSLAGLAGAGETSAVAHAAQTGEVFANASNLVYGPYPLDVALRVKANLEYQGYFVHLVHGPEGYLVVAD